MNSIDEICDKFEADIRRDKPYSIAEYLNLFSGDRTECLSQLLQIEFEILLEGGKEFDVNKYYSIFPDHPKAIVSAIRAVKKRFPENFLPEQIYPEESGQNFSVILQVTHGPMKGHVLKFNDHQTCIVGRSKKAHLRLSSNPEFSRFHCRLEIKPPHIVVADLGSTNGTKVNGQRVQSATLQDGDQVFVGDTQFSVLIEKPEPVVQPNEQTLILPAQHESALDLSHPRIPGHAIERQIGHGGMGSVYLAKRIATGEKVAIKIICPVVATDARAVDKFRREAAIILRLQHKRIVKSIDFRINEDHLPYLVMEYIDQIDLLEFLDSSNLKDRCRIAAGLICRVLEGLQYAHDKEIVHRDVKPSNLLVYRSGKKLQVKLADFGLAKNFIDAGFSDCSESDEICGTLAYMSPEQIIDCRYAKPTCDIYAAGVCLYKMISGHLPYEAQMISEQISSILNQPPTPIEQHVSPVPAGMIKVLERALARSPSKRYSTAESMRQELLPFTKRSSQ